MKNIRIFISTSMRGYFVFFCGQVGGSQTITAVPAVLATPAPTGAQA